MIPTTNLTVSYLVPSANSASNVPVTNVPLLVSALAKKFSHNAQLTRSAILVFSVIKKVKPATNRGQKANNAKLNLNVRTTWDAARMFACGTDPLKTTRNLIIN
jgi:hypothetical protein